MDRPLMQTLMRLHICGPAGLGTTTLGRHCI
jgi:hypothetical protein